MAYNKLNCYNIQILFNLQKMTLKQTYGVYVTCGKIFNGCGINVMLIAHLSYFVPKLFPFPSVSLKHLNTNTLLAPSSVHLIPELHIRCFIITLQAASITPEPIGIFFDWYTAYHCLTPSDFSTICTALL